MISLCESLMSEKDAASDPDTDVVTALEKKRNEKKTQTKQHFKTKTAGLTAAYTDGCGQQ